MKTVAKKKNIKKEKIKIVVFFEIISTKTYVLYSFI